MFKKLFFFSAAMLAGFVFVQAQVSSSVYWPKDSLWVGRMLTIKDGDQSNGNDTILLKRNTVIRLKYTGDEHTQTTYYPLLAVPPWL
ncbi:MAG: hypothetical protein HC905_20020 [Bacteroidales bacterium]|nr:hypothetical protein [Bacteroidales bacterium]